MAHSDAGWCSCDFIASLSPAPIISKSLLYAIIAIATFLGIGICTKLGFDTVERRLFRRQRERAAAFKAAQVELGFMLQTDEDD
eukprot:751856-Hanusia_phi.AAC.1